MTVPLHLLPDPVATQGRASVWHDAMMSAPRPTDRTTFEPEDLADWRVWLATHHDSESEVWLVYRKGAAARIHYGESVEEALCFGWIDGLVRRIDEVRYVRRFTPRRPGSIWSATNKERVARVLAEGRMSDAGLRVVEAAQADGSRDRESTAEQEWDVPVELTDALAGDADAAAAFEQASPSHRRQFVTWVASAKREETRRRRADRAAGMLRRGERPM
jgi:uncharacterized protein YdeI (YjbR/CyaY-like superfamily)